MSDANINFQNMIVAIVVACDVLHRVGEAGAISSSKNFHSFFFCQSRASLATSLDVLSLVDPNGCKQPNNYI